jgi:hypothetical protein
MTQVYEKNKFDNDELNFAISLLENEHPREDRNTLNKMSALICSNFDVSCTPEDVSRVCGFTEENWEQISASIEYLN